MTFALVAALPIATIGGRVRPAGAAPIAVRYAEGSVHGFLALSTAAGAPLANGDVLEVATNGVVASRLVFHFADSSLFEESVTFTEDGVFAMQDYHLVQRGPAFAQDLDASLSGSGKYLVITKSHQDGRERRYAGTLSLPRDVYDGMVIIIAKNVSPRTNTTIHIVAFTPAPHVIKLELAPSGSSRVLLGNHAETAVRFEVKPELGFWLRLGANLTGQLPPDSKVWIIPGHAPAFVGFEGPLYTGPVWRIALAKPTWPQ
ncbi:MAG: hypothetical protein ACYCVL_11865 [Gemmatimonadaceae bacterium]